MTLVLSEYEKKNGVKIAVSPDTYVYKCRIIDGNIFTVCSYKNCLNVCFKLSRCKKHIIQKPKKR